MMTRRAVGLLFSPLRVLIVLVLFACACGGELPMVIRDELAITSKVKPGAATVVFFTDFQCPHCRRTHAALAAAVDAEAHQYERERRHEPPARIVLRHVPLPRHPDARTAARAAVCVEKLTSALLDDYAHALFESQDLSEGSVEEMAVERGVDRDRFQRCLSDAATDARIEQDLAMFDAVKGDGVPLLFIGRARLEGSQSQSTLEAALSDAISRK